MVFKDQYNFESLVNEAEELVAAEIARRLPEYPDLCTCSECILGAQRLSSGDPQGCCRRHPQG
jgi:competence protein ComFB